MLKFFNTLTGKKEEFSEIKKDEVRIYTCGPTVYNFAHIGNFRAYVFEDILRRYLKFKDYRVIQVMNITDVDDKTIRGAKENNVGLNEFTEKYTNYFFEDLETLGIERAEYYPKATEHINEMIELVQKLEKNGYTYLTQGSVYFKISKFKNYGKLSKIDIAKIKSGLRYDTDEYKKDDVRDFVLWKIKKTDEPFWASTYGDGRPGWHIECSAMSMKYLGENFDIHTGGVDNIFPHHENEIAQSEGATGKKFVNYWLHCSHLTIKDDKMSKSKGNIIYPRELIAKGYSPKIIRYFLMASHYRSPMNFGENELEHARGAIARLNNSITNLNFSKNFNEKSNPNIKNLIEKCVNQFTEYMDDDLNISGGLGALFTFITKINTALDKNEISESDRNEIIFTLQKLNSVLNVMDFSISSLDNKINALISERELARKNKDYKKSDQLRKQIESYGILLEDTKDGQRWKHINKK
jgi:cysteinyl-tRNA synthetase